MHLFARLFQRAIKESRKPAKSRKRRDDFVSSIRVANYPKLETKPKKQSANPAHHRRLPSHDDK